MGTIKREIWAVDPTDERRLYEIRHEHQEHHVATFHGPPRRAAARAKHAVSCLKVAKVAARVVQARKAKYEAREAAHVWSKANPCTDKRPLYVVPVVGPVILNEKTGGVLHSCLERDEIDPCPNCRKRADMLHTRSRCDTAYRL